MQFEKDLQSEHKVLFLKVRDLLMTMDGAVEVKKNRITTYYQTNGSICHMRTTNYGVDIGFLKGARLVDTYHLLIGKGKLMRVLPLRSFEKDIIQNYLNQAIVLNTNR